jgi:CDP-6-deoxy-D-xylo-4-hexulose-3-dehydrase
MMLSELVRREVRRVAGAAKEYFYPTAFCGWGEEEHDAINRVLISGKFTMGEEVRAFERELAAYHGRKHAVMVNSGSSANLLMVATLIETGRIYHGDMVMVPALAWSTTYAPLVQHGLKLQLVDCDETWNAAWPDRDGFPLQVICSILGNPCERLSDDYYTVIEDNCESIGAVNADGHKTGTMGLMSSLSFFYSHQLSAIEGGAVLTDDDECDEMLRMLRSHGWDKDVRPPGSFEDEYNFCVFGYNLRGLEMHAAIGREQLKKLDRSNAARLQNYYAFYEMADGLSFEHQQIRRMSVAAPFGIAFTVKDQATRLKLVHALRDADIDCRLPTGGSFRLHQYGKLWCDQKTPNADRIHQTGLFLGNAPFDISDKIERAVQVMRKVL